MIDKMFHVKHFIVIKSRSRNKKVKNRKKLKVENDLLLVTADIKGYFKI